MAQVRIWRGDHDGTPDEQLDIDVGSGHHKVRDGGSGSVLFDVDVDGLTELHINADAGDEFSPVLFGGDAEYAPVGMYLEGEVTIELVQP